MSLKLVINQTDEQAQRAVEIKKMFIDLECPRCGIKARSQKDVDWLRENCEQCNRGKR